MKVQADSYVLLYSLYSYPNVILCFFGGFLLDRVFGMRWGYFWNSQKFGFSPFLTPRLVARIRKVDVQNALYSLLKWTIYKATFVMKNNTIFFKK